MPSIKIINRLLQLTKAIACEELCQDSAPHTGHHLFSIINAIDKEYRIYLKTEDYRGAKDFIALAELVEREVAAKTEPDGIVGRHF